MKTSKALKLFATAAAFILGGYSAQAQTAKSGAKADTVVTKKVVQPMTQVAPAQIKKNGDSTFTTTHYHGTSLLQRKASSYNFSTTNGEQTTQKVKVKLTPQEAYKQRWAKWKIDNKATDEQVRAAKDAENKHWIELKAKNPKVKIVTPSITVDQATQTQKSTKEQEKQYKDQTLVVKDSTSTVITVTRNVPAPVPEKKVEPKKGIRIRLSVGTGEEKSMGPQLGPNPDASNYATKTYDLNQGRAQYYYAQAIGYLGPHGSVGEWVKPFVRYEAYKNKALPFLVSSGMTDCDNGPYDAFVTQAKLRDNLKTGLKIGPTIGSGFVKVEPTIEGGFMFKKKADVTIFPGQNYTLDADQQKDLSKNMHSKFYGAGLNVYLDFFANKKDVKRDSGPFIEGNVDYYRTTEKAIFRDQFTGAAIDGLQNHLSVRVGAGWRF